MSEIGLLTEHVRKVEAGIRVREFSGIRVTTARLLVGHVYAIGHTVEQGA